MDELEKMIDKYDNTTISGMNIKEQTLVFNFLKELQMYRRVGTLNAECIKSGMMQSAT